MARNNRDWHQLLELCSVFGVLIADGERLYDPRAYHDRLLLGLSGIMSEAELHQIRMRLHQGERQKAARGELGCRCRPGSLMTEPAPSSSIPMMKCRRVCYLVFAKFRELQSARGVMRFLRSERIAVAGPTGARTLPARGDLARGGQRKGAVISCTIRPMLGLMFTAVGKRIRADAAPDRCGEPSRWRSRTGRFACRPLTLVISAGRSSWPTSGEWQTTSTAMRQDTAGVPRKGSALLQGIAICGRCGRRMSVRYTGPNGDYPVYCCRADRDQRASALCQEVRALAGRRR